MTQRDGTPITELEFLRILAQTLRSKAERLDAELELLWQFADEEGLVEHWRARLKRRGMEPYGEEQNRVDGADLEPDGGVPTGLAGMYQLLRDADRGAAGGHGAE